MRLVLNTCSHPQCALRPSIVLVSCDCYNTRGGLKPLNCTAYISGDWRLESSVGRATHPLRIWGGLFFASSSFWWLPAVLGFCQHSSCRCLCVQISFAQSLCVLNLPLHSHVSMSVVLAFCHCDKKSENNSLKEERFILAHDFRGFYLQQKKVGHFMAAGKQSERERAREDGTRDESLSLTPMTTAFTCPTPVSVPSQEGRQL